MKSLSSSYNYSLFKDISGYEVVIDFGNYLKPNSNAFCLFSKWEKQEIILLQKNE